MSRYIDADELTKYPWFVEIHGETIDDIAEQIIKACKHIVKSAPSIDIVRCKECKHCKRKKGTFRGEPIFFYRCAEHNRDVESDDFCSWGEREGE